MSPASSLERLFILLVRTNCESPAHLGAGWQCFYKRGGMPVVIQDSQLVALGLANCSIHFLS